VVEALAAEGADDPFGERVLPGCSGSDDHGANSHAGQAPGDALAVDGIPIAEEISWRGLVWEGLEDLAGGPDCRGQIRHVEVEELAAVMTEHDEGEEEAVGEGGNEKEVDGDDVASMGGEKGTPRGRRVSRRPVHVLGDGQLGDLVGEEGQLRPKGQLPRGATCWPWWLDTLVPPGDGFPGAGAVALDHVLAMAAASADLERLLSHGLQAVEEASRANDAAGLASLSVSDRASVLRRVEHAEFFEPLVRYTYGGYYSHPPVIAGLGLNASPPHPRGHRVEAVDLPDLAGVSVRGPIYRHA
jgi:hypothetical protein